MTSKEVKKNINARFGVHKPHKIFLSKKSAIEWVDKHVEDGCVDNHRFTYLSDKEGLQKYYDQLEKVVAVITMPLLGLG
jgi:hypothetical protein